MQPLSEKFWQTISASKGDPDQLKDILDAQATPDVMAFGREFNQALINLNQWKIWGAGYVMAGGMSDDSFHYLRSWIIGRGQDAYETALAWPDDLGSFAEEDEEEFENEGLEYVWMEVLESRGIENDPRNDTEATPDDDPAGQEWDEDSVYDLFPKLAKQFG